MHLHPRSLDALGGVAVHDLNHHEVLEESLHGADVVLYRARTERSHPVAHRRCRRVAVTLARYALNRTTSARATLVRLPPPVALRTRVREPRGELA